MVMFLIVSAIVLAAIGVLVALPMWSPKLKKRAIVSPSFRISLVLRQAVIAFCISFLGIQMLNAVVTSILWQVTAFAPPPCVQEDCAEEYHRLVKGGAFKPPFIIELWLHYIVPPPMLSEDQCFTGNKVVCHLVNERKSGTPERHIKNYLIGLLMLSIPAITCALAVIYLTSDDGE